VRATGTHDDARGRASHPPAAREIPVCGWKAVEAVFAKRPECVRRLFFDPVNGRRAGGFSKYLARERRIYRQVTAEELGKISGTVHHGGIVAVTARESPAPVLPSEIEQWSRARRPLVIVDRVANPHNLGALVRTAAYFGVPTLLHGEHRDQAQPGESTYRIAEGGMEYVDVRPVRGLPAFIRAIRPHYFVVGAALQGEPLDRVRAPRPDAVRAGGGPDDMRPCAVVLGNEESGLAPAVLAACERRVLIPGRGHLDSLNVSAAGAVLMHWFFGREG
jgi:TrmH RNA methyltransferase